MEARDPLGRLAQQSPRLELAQPVLVHERQRRQIADVADLRWPDAGGGERRPVVGDVGATTHEVDQGSALLLGERVLAGPLDLRRPIGARHASARRV